MIIDSHVHLDSYGQKESTETMIDRLSTDMKTHGINKAVVLTATHSPDWADKGLMDIIPVLQERGLLNTTIFLIGSAGAQVTETDLANLKRLLHNRIIRGVKLYPGYEDFYPFDERLFPVYELCIQFDVPCFFHCGSTYSKKASIETAHPIHIDRVALRYPDLKIIICHLAMPWYQDCAMLMERHKNVYADISGFITPGSNSNGFEILKQALIFINGYVGSYDKVLFGTDWIICKHDDYLRFMDCLVISQEDRENILYRNIQRIMDFQR